jgi:putative CocE/NonD family hydrolase
MRVQRLFGVALLSVGCIAAAVLANEHRTPTDASIDTKSKNFIEQHNVRIRMRDGVTLSADIYRPATTDRVPIVLARTPYTKGREATAAHIPYPEQGRWWANRGYAFVIQDVRGRGDSDGGPFYPLVHEAADGFDTLDWLGKQPWSSGRVGMIGSSYLGWVQVYAAAEQSPYLKAIVPTVTPPDPDRNWPRNYGVMYLPSVGWAADVEGRTEQAMPDFESLFPKLPLLTLDTVMGRNLPVWRDWVTHPAHDPYWEPQRYQEKLLKAKVPAMHVGGWYDSVSVGITENFVNVSQHGPDAETRRQQRLLMGPWEHGINSDRRLGDIDFGSDALIDFVGAELRWFDHWLKGINNGVDRDPPVRVFLMGANRWIEENEWPIARTNYVKYFLHSKGKANSTSGDGELSRAERAAESADHFRYDPANPVPFVNLFKLGGSTSDYREVEKRPDVLVYTTEPMSEPTRVCGPIKVKLFAASSALDTDWTARFLDVHPDGYAQRLQDGLIRARYRHDNGKQELLKPGETYEYDIDLWAICTELGKGHRVRVEISSSMFPFFARNLNTGGDLATETRPVIAQQTVLHDSEHASYLVLPIVPPRP